MGPSSMAVMLWQQYEYYIYQGFIQDLLVGGGGGGGTSERMPNTSNSKYIYNSERRYMQCFPILRVNVTL